MEKLIISIDGLKTSAKKKGAGLTSKEKTALCLAICESIMSLDVKQHPDYAKIFNSSFEALFLQCDDSSADVRIVAEEAMVSVIRHCTLEGNIGRVHVEIFQEIRRNGSARSVRSALCKFAALADQVRSQKRRPFAVNLVPCLINIARRPEDSVSECLEKQISSILSPLCKYLNDEETKLLIKSVLPNLQLPSSQARRCASTFLINICRFCRKKCLFVGYLTSQLIDILMPSNPDRSPNHMIGALTSTRLLIPLIKECDDAYLLADGLTKHSTSNKDLSQYGISIETLLQIYELIVYYVCLNENTVVTCALECLSCLLQNLPRRLEKILTSDKGRLEKSRITIMSDQASCSSGLSSRVQSLATLSLTGDGLSSRTSSKVDWSALLDLEESSKDVDGRPTSDGSQPEDFARSDPENLPSFRVQPHDECEISGECDDVPMLLVQRGESLERDILTLNVNEDDDEPLIDVGESVNQNINMYDPLLHSSSLDSPMSSNRPEEKSVKIESSTATTSDKPFVSFYPDDIGNFLGESMPLRFLSRCLCRKFLLVPTTAEESQRQCQVDPLTLLLPDRDIRVSQKTLALNCLSSVLRNKPELFFASLTVDEDVTRISNVLFFATHCDHLLRAELILLTASLIKALLQLGPDCHEEIAYSKYLRIIENGLLDQHFSVVRSSLLATELCQNELLLYKDFFDSNALLNVFYAALSKVSDECYWTIKFAALKMWASLVFSRLQYVELEERQDKLHKVHLTYQDNVLDIIIDTLLKDENARIRTEASKTLCCMVRTMYPVGVSNRLELAAFTLERLQQETTVFCGSSSNFYWFHDDYPKIHNLHSVFVKSSIGRADCLLPVQEGTLSNIVAKLFQFLSAPKDVWHLSGILAALHELANKYPPSHYFNAWSTVLSLDVECSTEFFNSLLKILSAYVLGTECTNIHKSIFGLLSHLLAGCVANAFETKSSTMQANNGRWPLLSTNENHAMNDFLSTDFITYCLRVLSVYFHVITDTTPAPPPFITKAAPIPHIVAQQTLTPMTQKFKAVTKLDIGKAASATDKTEASAHLSLTSLASKIGDFCGIAQFMKLYDIVKGGWANYKTCLEGDVLKRFSCVLVSCLDCLSTVLEFANQKFIEKFAEEALLYLKVLVNIVPAHVVNTVIQILKAMFGTNLNLLINRNTDFDSIGNSPDSMSLFARSRSVKLSHRSMMIASPSSFLLNFGPQFSLYQTCIVKSRAKFAQLMSSAVARHDLVGEALERHFGWLGSRADKYVGNMLKKPAHKAALTNYIRLFEPIVVQALRLYTTSVCIETQRAVIDLLIHLVQIRVNYCLLDNDQRFLNFLFQQLENTDESSSQEEKSLMKSLFEFFIVLSYEKYQGKSAIDASKILQLSDVLLASIGSCESIGFLALHGVVMDFFLQRMNAKIESGQELEIQQECITALLLKSVHIPQALDLFTFVLYRLKRDNEAKWKKLSRDVIDALLPALSRNQIAISNTRCLQSVLNLMDFVCSGALRPADSFLEIIFQSPTPHCTEPERFINWLCIKYACWYAVIVHCKEDAVISRLEVLKPELGFHARICHQYRNLTPDYAIHSAVTPLTSCHENAGLRLARVAAMTLALSINELVHHSSDASLESRSLFKDIVLRYVHLLIHICQSGSFRIFFTELASVFKQQYDLNASLVNRTVFDLLVSRFPEIGVQYLYLISSLNAFVDVFWQSLIDKSTNCNVHAVSLIASILYADRLKTNFDNDFDAIDLTKFLGLVDESPVCEMIEAIFSDQRHSPKLLRAIEKAVLSESGIPIAKKLRLIRLMQKFSVDQYCGDVILLLLRIMKLPYRVLSSAACQILKIRLEELLADGIRNSYICNRMKQIVQEFKEFGCSSRFPEISASIGRLAQLCNFPYAPESSDEDLTAAICTPVNKFKKTKFIYVMQLLIRKDGSLIDYRPLVEVLSSLNVEECIEMLSDWEIPPAMIEACLQYAAKKSFDTHSSTDTSRIDPIESSNCPSVSIAATKALISLIRPATVKLIKETEITFLMNCCNVIWNHRESKHVPSDVKRLLELIDCVKILLKFPCLLTHLTPADFSILLKFSVVALTACWSFRDVVPLVNSLSALRLAVMCLNATAVIQLLNSADVTYIQLYLCGICFWLIIDVLGFQEIWRFEMPVIRIPAGIDTERQTIIRYAIILLNWIEISVTRSTHYSHNYLFKMARRVTFALARLPVVNSFCKIPPAAYKFGWDPELKSNESTLVLSTLPVHYLQNIDILRAFMFRVQSIGWINRQDFEEIWMALLGVLSATPVGEELTMNSVQEITERLSTSTLTVRFLTSLLLQTMLYPTSGDPSSSVFLLKQREKESAFLKTSSGRCFLHLKRLINRYETAWRPSFDLNLCPCDFRLKHGRQTTNVERLHNMHEFSVNQFPVDTLWALTGILAEEENLIRNSPAIDSKDSLDNSSGFSDVGVESTSSQNYENLGPKGHSDRQCISRFIQISQADLNISSCLHFLMDLFGHWLTNGPDAVPLPLLTATVESVTMLSDLLNDSSQYAWLRDKLNVIFQSRSVDDELIVPYTVLGTLKAWAVTMKADAEKEKEAVTLIDTGLRHVQLVVRIATLHGACYLLQTMTSDEIVAIMPMLSEYILSNLSVYALFDGANVVLEKPQSMDHQLACWALAFFIIESFHDPHTKQSFCPKFLDICIKALANRNIPVVIFNAVCNGLECVLSSSSVEFKFVKQIIAFSSSCIQDNNCADAVVLSIRLLLCCLYNAKETNRSDDVTSPDTESASSNFGEPTVSAMEKLSLLLSRITHGNQREAELLAGILPNFLGDNFNPGDVMNKIITELLLLDQPYPELFMCILVSVMKSLLSREARSLVSEWLLLSMPTFTHSKPGIFSIWCLTCLFLCTSSNEFASKIWPVAKLIRWGSFKSIAESFLCFACDSFKTHLTEDQQQINNFKSCLEHILASLPESDESTGALRRSIDYCFKQ